MASTAAANLTSTGNYADARYPEFLQARIQEYGRRDYILENYLEPVTIPKGYSNQYQITRAARIPTPLTGLSESITPSATALTLDTVSGTTTQYGIVCSYSDVAEVYQRHSLLQQAADEIADAMKRLRQWVAASAFMALTNVVYPGTVTARGSLAATDIMDTATLRSGIRQLRQGLDTKLGAPEPWAGNLFPAITHPVVLAQLRGDAVFEKQATNARPEWLEKGAVKEWEGFAFVECNHMPVLTNLATGMASLSLTDATPVSDSTGGLNGLTATINTGSGTVGDSVHYMKVTRRHRWLGFEDGVSSILTLMDTNDATSSYDIVAPDDTDYIYNFYFGDSAVNSDLFLHASGTGLAADATFNIAADLTSGTNPPAHPAVSVTVYPTFVPGRKWGFMPTLMAQETYVVQGADKNDVLNQQTFVGAKTNIGAFVGQDDFAIRFETGA